MLDIIFYPENSWLGSKASLGGVQLQEGLNSVPLELQTNWGFLFLLATGGITICQPPTDALTEVIEKE